MVPVRRSALVLLAIGALSATSAVAPGPAVADAPSGATSVTVFLKAPDPAGLDQLAANASGLTREQRVAALASLVPSAQTHAAVEDSLRRQGFTVTGSTTWSITARGAAATSKVMFGERAVHSDSRVAAAGALPRVPDALTGVVSAVYPTTGGPAAFHHASLTGLDFRRAGTPARVAPSTGQHDAGAAIATVQLANFYGNPSGFANSTKAADLTSYAHEHHLVDPVANGQYHAIKVDGGPSETDDQQGGDIEVNLDQQSILSTAPTADQRAYFAPNTEAGFDDVFSTVFDDVVSGAENIVALSSSWGQCESQTGSRSIATVEPILKALTAAGVTIFSAAGDYGIYDCGTYADGSINSLADVDYPGSSPSVISVGGTRLDASRSVPNNGTNWRESAWACTSADECQSQDGTGGGGGGRSGEAFSQSDFAGFRAPTYQRAGIDDRPFAGNAKRLVPDIAGDADPASGFRVYTSNPEQVFFGGGNDVTIGGTSLAAPISAAQLTNALCDAGHKHAVGDIHGALYSAYRATRSYAPTNPKKAFRDVTKGSNGMARHRLSNPSVTAQRGYDTVSGLGGVLWPAVLPYIFDKHRPTGSARIAQPALHTRQWAQVQATWTIRQGADLRLLGSTKVVITRRGSSRPVHASTTFPASNSYSFHGAAGATYTVTVTGHDVAGHAAAPHSATITVPVDDSKFVHSKAWSRVQSRYDIGGSHLLSTGRKAAAKITARGRAYRLVVDTGPHAGKLGVYGLGRRLAVIDLHTRGYARRSVTIYTSRSSASRTFVFRALSASGVSIDGLSVTP